MLLGKGLVHCRSLGLILLECANGKYPYDASDGPLQLMLQVPFSCLFLL